MYIYPPGIQTLNMGNLQLMIDYNGTVMHYPIVCRYSHGIQTLNMGNLQLMIDYNGTVMH